MLCSWVAVVPSDTLVLPVCAVVAGGVDFLAPGRDVLSPTWLVGSGLPGLSIFTMILSI
jgi:hypothetical protein